MPASLPKLDGATERKSLADVSGHQVKADLRPQVAASPLREVAKDTVRAVASQKAAASDIGISESRVSHKFDDGSMTLAQLEALGPTYAAEFGRRLLEVYGPLQSPRAQVKQEIREMRQRLDRLDQFVDFIS